MRILIALLLLTGNCWASCPEGKTLCSDTLLFNPCLEGYSYDINTNKCNPTPGYVKQPTQEERIKTLEDKVERLGNEVVWQKNAIKVLIERTENQ